MVNLSISEGFVNSTGSTAAILKGLYDNVGGSWFTTILIIILFVILIALVVRVPFELTAAIIFPLVIVSYVYVPSSGIVGVTGAFLIYLGVLVGKLWFFNK